MKMDWEYKIDTHFTEETHGGKVIFIRKKIGSKQIQEPPTLLEYTGLWRKLCFVWWGEFQMKGKDRIYTKDIVNYLWGLNILRDFTQS